MQNTLRLASGYFPCNSRPDSVDFQQLTDTNNSAIKRGYKLQISPVVSWGPSVTTSP